MFKFIKDLIFKLLILIIVVLIASQIINIKNNTQRHEQETVQPIQKIKNKINYIHTQKDEPNEIETSNNQEELNKLVEKLNAHIDEQTYLLSYYLDDDLSEEKIKILASNLTDIKKDAKKKKISHLIDMPQIEELENQLEIYCYTLQQKNKSL